MPADERHPGEATDFGRERWPARAAVRGVRPIGIGTAWVEALSGYLIRTAIANGLSPRRFIDRVIAVAVGDPSTPGASTEDIIALGHSIMGRPAAAVNGGWQTASVLVEILSAATLQGGLDQLTLIGWSDRLFGRDLLRSLRAFCPVCLWEWARDGLPAYEPLRWQFQALEACVTHGVRLREVCLTPRCGRTRGAIAGWASIQRCTGCRRPLARSIKEVRAVEVPLDAEALDWAGFVDAELGDLIAYPPAHGEGLGPYRFPEILGLAVESVTAGRQRAFAERIGMTEASVSYWKDDRRRPSLLSLLRVCRAAGFGLRDVLMGNVEALAASPAPLDVRYIAPSVEQHQALDAKVMERVLEDALVAVPPPTLASIYRDARVDRSHVRRRFPVLCAAIRERRVAFSSEERRRRREERERLLVEAIHAVHALGVYPSKNQVRKILPERFRLIDEDIVGVWRRELIALGWGDPSILRRVKGEPMPLPTIVRTRRGNRVARPAPLVLQPVRSR